MPPQRSLGLGPLGFGGSTFQGLGTYANQHEYLLGFQEFSVEELTLPKLRSNIIEALS